MRKFFKDNIWLFAIVAAILVMLGIFGYYSEKHDSEMNRLSGKEKVKGRDISRTIDEFKYKGKTYTFVIYERCKHGSKRTKISCTMEKVDIFDQEIGRAAIECNGNLVVVFNGKKAFWFKEQIESFVKEHPEAPLPLSVFCVAVSKVGEPCKYKSTGNSFSFVARSVSRSEALSEY
ncbi:MAG: hypothetical protein EP152_01965 [Prevotella copri]|nr:hypothetical protein [Segatella copri]